MTKSEAIGEIIWEARREAGSNAAIKRLLRASEALGLNGEETVRLLSALGYCSNDGVPYRYYAAKWPLHKAT